MLTRPLWWQAEAERRKRAQILESEGARQSKINVAEGNKADIILSSEAAQQDSINRAMGALHPTTNGRLLCDCHIIIDMPLALLCLARTSW